MPGGLRVTPYHPVWVPALRARELCPRLPFLKRQEEALERGEKGFWVLPADTGHEEARVRCGYIVSVALRNAETLKLPAVVADGVASITLAHGITEGLVAHPFFGTRRVIEQLPLDMRVAASTTQGSRHQGNTASSETEGGPCGAVMDRAGRYVCKSGCILLDPTTRIADRFNTDKFIRAAST